MKLRVRSISGETNTIDGLSENGTVHDLMKEIKNTFGIKLALQRILFAGKELKSQQTFKEMKLADNAVIHLIIRKNPAKLSNNVVKTHIPAANPSTETPSASTNPYLHFPGASIIIEVAPDQQNSVESSVFSNPESLFRILKLSKTVQTFSVIDSIFLCVYGISYPLLFLFLALSISGFIGARKVIPNLILGYLIYLFASISVRIYLLVSSPNPGLVAILVIGVVLQMFIARWVNQFYWKIAKLSAPERFQIQELQIASWENNVLANS